MSDTNSSGLITQNFSTNNAKYISIIPENGTEFVAGQKMVFNIDPSIGWIKGRDSYLTFEIENVSAKMNLTLKNGGISSIIKQVNIFSAQNGMLLETLDNYNQWTACEMQYRYDDPTQLTNIEGCPNSIFSRRGFVVGSQTGTFQNWRNNYYQPESHRLTQVNSGGIAQNGPVRFSCPLRCGIFRHWDEESLVPVLQMGGLRIELIMADNLEVMDMAWSGKTRVAHISNNMIMAGSDTTLMLGVEDFLATDTTILISDVLLNVEDTGFMVGQTIALAKVANDPSPETLVISGMDKPADKVRLTFTTAIGAPTTTTTQGTIRLDNATMMTEANIKYKITNAEFRLLQEMPPDNKMKNLDYVFTSYDLFRDTIPGSQLNYNQDITSTASKAVSIFTMYEDPQYDAISSFPNQHYYQGITPDEQGVNLNSIVYFINNRLYPLRPYNPQRCNDKVINHNEVVKAFGTLNLPVKSLGCNEASSLDCYTNRYLHARELARGDSVFSLQNAEPQIRIGFSAIRGTDKRSNQIGNMKMNSFVFSKKVLHIDGDSGLSLEH